MTLALLLAACSPSPTLVESDLAAQLELATVSSDACVDPGTCLGDAVAAGALAVAGDARDPVLTVGGVAFAIHSPTSAPLAALAGREVTASVRYDYFMPASLTLADAEGLVYVVETGAGDAFAAFDVAWGDEKDETVTEDDWVLTYRDLVVQTDDGPVALVPGDVAGIVVDGVSWRFSVIASYEVGTLPDGEYPDCGGRSPMLSYEAVRVDEEVEPARLLRPEGLEMAGWSGCGG